MNYEFDRLAESARFYKVVEEQNTASFADVFLKILTGRQSCSDSIYAPPLSLSTAYV